MQIPRTKEEFVVDLIQNGNDSIRITLGIVFGLVKVPFNYVRKEMSRDRNAITCVADFVGSHIKNYGVHSPIIPSQLDNIGNIKDLLEKVWNDNAEAILALSRLRVDKLIMKDRNLIMGTSLLSDPQFKNWVLQQEDSPAWSNGWFTNLPYQERKFIMPVQSFDDYKVSMPNIHRFRISKIPSDIKFEECFPTVGELYIAHPFRKSVYLLASKYEHIIFRERIHELSKVMMALGATEIRTLQYSGTTLSSSSNQSSNTHSSLGYDKWGGATGGYACQSNKLDYHQKEDSIVINFKNDPVGQPKIPSGLVWYPHDKEWQYVAESRIHGNMLEYEIKLSSKQFNLISNAERSSIEAQARALLVSGSFSRETSTKSFFKEEAAKTTNILIKFKSRKDY